MNENEYPQTLAENQEIPSLNAVSESTQQLPAEETAAFMPQASVQADVQNSPQTVVQDPEVVVSESKTPWWRTRAAMVSAGVLIVVGSFGLGYGANELVSPDADTTMQTGEFTGPGGEQGGEPGQMPDGSDSMQGGQMPQDGQNSDGAGTLQQPGQDDAENQDGTEDSGTSSDDADNASSNT